jgi:hypothetical protein
MVEQRRAPRFQLQLPLSITRLGESARLDGFTRNISSSGVLFTTVRELDVGGPIVYVIFLNHEGTQSASLRCIGRVLRADLVGTGQDQDCPNYQIAATLERYEFTRSPSRSI